MRKWIDQATFDELLLANAEDNIERAIRSASAVLEAVQEFVPDAALFYRVTHAIFCDKDSKKSTLIKIRFLKIHIAFGPIDILLSVAIGKDKPGPVGRASLSGFGTEKSSSPGLRYFSVPAPSPRAYESSRGNRPVRDIKPHNILFIACAIHDK